MRILFIISVLKQGRGGHYHSLNHISREIAKTNSVHLISIGTNESEIISENPYFLTHIHFDGFNLRNLYKKFNSVLDKSNPEIIHCFDANAYNVIKPFVRSKKYKIVTNLCGGPNPSDYPKVENLVLFSRENQKWFEAKNKYDDTLIKLIPNRVSKIHTAVEQKFQKDLNFFSFVRIALISDFHFTSIKQTITLFKKL